MIVQSPPVPDSSAQPRLLIVDDHPVFRLGIARLLGKERDIVICGEAENATAALDAMRRLTPDVVLLDVSMPGPNGIETIKLMLAEQPRLIILVLSMHEESLYALRALRAGAKGYVMKHQAIDNVVQAVRKVLAGGVYVSPQFGEQLIFKAIQGSNGDVGMAVDTLSDRELEVLQLFGRGKSTREVASMCTTSPSTQSG